MNINVAFARLDHCCSSMLLNSHSCLKSNSQELTASKNCSFLGY